MEVVILNKLIAAYNNTCSTVILSQKSSLEYLKQQLKLARSNRFMKRSDDHIKVLIDQHGRYSRAVREDMYLVEGMGVFMTKNHLEWWLRGYKKYVKL